MASGKTVWIVDRQRSLYLDAIPVLAAKGVNLQFVGPEAQRSADPTGSCPDLIIMARDFEPVWRQVTRDLDPIPETWEIRPDDVAGPGLASHAPLIPGSVRIAAFTSATDLVALLTPLPPRLALATVPQPKGSSRYIVSLADQEAALTAREFAIIRILSQANGTPASRQDIFQQVWSGAKVCSKTLDVHISKLRRKLQPLGVSIEFRAPASYVLVHK